MRAGLFLRVSTDDQTAANQRPDVEQLAAARGLEVVKVYEETGSGARRNRAELAAMLADAHRGAFQVLVIWALDRLGRSMWETIEVVRKLDAAGVQVVSVMETWLDMGGPARPLLLAMLCWVAEWERDRLIERTRAGMDRARRQGKHVGRPERAVPLAMARALLGAPGASVRGVAGKLGVPPSTLRRALQKGSDA